MKNEKTGKIKTVRGSVLFTTVSVMALLIIFLTGALALASSANNRAHKSYASSQASYNARAAIDSFTQAMVNNVGVAAAVHDMGTAGLHPTLSIDGKAWKKHAEGEEPVANGWGTIGYYDASGKFQEGQIDVQKTDNKEYGWDPKGGENGLGAWIELNQYKITATAKYGKEEETVTAFLKTRIREEEEVTEIKGLQSLGAISPDSASIIYGGIGLGLNDNESPFSANHLYSGARYATRTELTFINGSVILGNGNNEFGVYTNNSKTIVLGNFRVNNGSKLIWVDYEGGAPQRQKDIPYFFVNGLLSISNAKNFVQSFSSETGSMPFNIFAGTIDVQTETLFGSSDIYLMDEVSEREYTIDGRTVQAGKNKISGSGSGSHLYNWTETFNGGSDYEVTTGGNVYCKGDLELDSCIIDGDVRVEGNCRILNNVKITGDLLVGGELFANSSDLNVTGEISVGLSEYSNLQVLKNGYDIYKNKRIDNIAMNQNNKDTIAPGYGVMDIENIEVAAKPYTSAWMQQGNGGAGGPCLDVEGTIVEVDQYGTYYVTDDERYYFNEKPYYLVDVNGNQTEEVVTESITKHYVKIVQDAEGNTTYEEVTYDDVYKQFYYKKDANGNQTSEVTDKAFYYVETDKSGNVKNPIKETNEAENYYKIEADGSLTKLPNDSGIYETVTVASIPEDKNIYPVNMTREKIYGIVNETEDPTTHKIISSLVPADSSTKLITTLEEARKALALSATEGTAPDAVYDAEKLLCDRQLATKDEFEHFELDMSKFETYTDANITNGMELTGAKNYYFTGSINKKKFTIFTGSNDINVVLDGVTLGDDETKIAVDTTGDTGGGKGSVTFFVLNGLTLSKGRIINSKLDPESLPAGQTKPTAKYTDDYGMIFYSDKNTTLHFDSSYSMLTGSLKMPFAHLTASSVSPTITFDYEDEFKHSFGYYSKASNGEARPRIVGNGIFADTKLPNDFLLLYTKTGNNSGMGGGSRVLYSATNDIYELSYYGAA